MDFWATIKDKVKKRNRQLLGQAAEVAELKKRGADVSRLRVPRLLDYNFIRVMKQSHDPADGGKWILCERCPAVDCLRMGGNRRPHSSECPYYFRF